MVSKFHGTMHIGTVLSAEGRDRSDICLSIISVTLNLHYTGVGGRSP